MTGAGAARPDAGPADSSGANAAWVRIETPLGPDQLRAMLDDVERLIRINPMLEIGAFVAAGADQYRLSAHNLGNGRDMELVLRVSRGKDAVEIDYDNGLKLRTTLRAEGREGGGSVLVVTDEYARLSDSEAQRRLGEVDRSLVAWGQGLRRFLIRWRRWSWLAPWRWYVERIWLPARPSSRRIMSLIWVVSALELGAFLIVVAIWSIV